MIQRCRCREPHAVNSIGDADTAGLIVSDLHCDSCGYVLDNDDRRILMIQRVGLELWKYYAAQEFNWASLQKLILDTRQPELPLQRIYRQQMWLSGYGVALGVLLIVCAGLRLTDWGPTWLGMFFTGFGTGASAVLLWFTWKHNRKLNAIQRRLEGSS